MFCSIRYGMAARCATDVFSGSNQQPWVFSMTASFQFQFTAHVIKMLSIVFQTNYLFQNQTHKHVPNVNCRLIQTRQIDTTHMAFKLLHSCLEWEFTFEVGRVFANTVGRKWNGYIWDYGLVVTITMATGFLYHYWDAGKVKELITSEQRQLCLVDAHTYP